MTQEKMYEIFGEINENYIKEARMPRKKNWWIKWGVLAASLCLVIGSGIQFHHWISGMNNGGCSFIQATGTDILEPHREEIIPDMDEEILVQLPEGVEVKKVYLLLENEWFLSDELSDFSQIVTNDIAYVTPISPQDRLENGQIENEFAYSFYRVNEEGELEEVYSSYPPVTAPVPYGLCGLTHEMIEKDLAGIEYDDYIITHSSSLGVFVWARSDAGDRILTYVYRPDFVGIQDGGIYTLEEMQDILAEAYRTQ